MHSAPHRILTLLLLTGLATAQEDPLEGHSGHGQAFNEGPRQAAYRMGGTGNVHFPVSDLQGRLQDLFDQGIGQLHGFWYLEAERTFRQIAAEAPDCAMAYWGMTMANVDNPDRAEGFASEAWERRERADDRERMYIDALANFYDVAEEESDEEGEAEEEPEEYDEQDEDQLLTRAERKQRDKESDAEWEAFKERAGQLVKDYEEIIWEYPEDIEAKAFLANRLWLNRRSGRSITSRHANEALLQQVLDANPMHPAHHYRIHLWDAKDSAARVVDSAVSAARTSNAGRCYAIQGRSSRTRSSRQKLIF